MRKSILERRIERLEKAIKSRNKRINEISDEIPAARARRRKFESASDINQVAKELQRILENELPKHDLELTDDFWERRGKITFDVQDDMGDEIYYDDWEANAEYFTLEDNGDGTFLLRVEGNFRNKVLGSFETARELANAIIESRTE